MICDWPCERLDFQRRLLTFCIGDAMFVYDQSDGLRQLATTLWAHSTSLVV